jgi:hypothetical protein
MSESKKCPQMQRGNGGRLPTQPPVLEAWQKQLGFGWDGRAFAYKCKNYGYIEFYFEK